MDIIISQPWGGLGDNLQFTTLPELYSKLGHKVYISDKNAYRNNELYNLIWNLNPYIAGISDKPANAGSCCELPELNDNFIKHVELAHGLSNGVRDYPVIYYKPKIIDGIEKYVFYDTTSITTNPSDSELLAAFTAVFNKYPELTPVRVEFKNIKNRVLGNLKTESYVINNIYEYCDVLYSCKVFVAGFSGSSALASAIKQDNPSPELYFLKPGYCHGGNHMFNNAHYLSLAYHTYH